MDNIGGCRKHRREALSAIKDRFSPAAQAQIRTSCKQLKSAYESTERTNQQVYAIYEKTSGEIKQKTDLFFDELIAIIDGARTKFHAEIKSGFSHLSQLLQETKDCADLCCEVISEIDTLRSSTESSDRSLSAMFELEEKATDLLSGAPAEKMARSPAISPVDKDGLLLALQAILTSDAPKPPVCGSKRKKVATEKVATNVKKDAALTNDESKPPSVGRKRKKAAAEEKATEEKVTADGKVSTDEKAATDEKKDNQSP